MARMEPAMRDYLTTMREQAFIDIKPGYSRHRRQPPADQADLQCLCAAHAQEKGESGAHPLPREHTHLPAEVSKAPQAADAGSRASRKAGKKEQ